MKKLINSILNKFGLVVYSNKKLNFYSTKQLKELYKLDEFDIAYLHGKTNEGLKEILLSGKKTRWLEIGCGGNFEPNFYYVDTFPESIVSEKEKYFRLDIVNTTESELNKLGYFDFIRMQHVFEHFTPEDGLKVLKNCAKILNPDGYILITTPDLKKFVHLYLSGKIKENFTWASQRIEKTAPIVFCFQSLHIVF